MSVWPDFPSTNLSLHGSEGALISVSVTVEPRYLEELLEALAQLDFPVNPQIYHDAAVRYFYPDGRQQTEPTTIVEFPAYAGHLAKVRQVLRAHGFPEDSLHVADMLDELHSDSHPEPAPPGAPYEATLRIKHVHAVAAAH